HQRHHGGVHRLVSEGAGTYLDSSLLRAVAARLPDARVLVRASADDGDRYTGDGYGGRGRRGRLGARRRLRRRTPADLAVPEAGTDLRQTEQDQALQGGSRSAGMVGAAKIRRSS